MTRFLTCIGLALVIGSFGSILSSKPLSAASGVCNNVCKQKCSAALSRRLSDDDGMRGRLGAAQWPDGPRVREAG
jgi:hypothetical protein